MNPLVSILIATYNRPRYFEQALVSALLQTYPNIEIIVGDNSTNDLTEKIVERYRSTPRGSVIRYVRHAENIGAIANQQRILNLANGEYINFLNDDDLFHPRKIETMMRHILSHTDVVLVTSQRRVIDKKGNRIYVPPLGTFKIVRPVDTVIHGRVLTKEMLEDQTNYIGEPTTALFRRRDLTEPFGVLAGKQVFFAVDMASWFSLMTRGHAIYLVQPLSFLRYHSEQLSQHKYAQKLGQMDYKVFERFAKLNGYV